MNSIISTSQSVLLRGRNLVDEVMIVNEIVDFNKNIKKPMFDSKGGF